MVMMKQQIEFIEEGHIYLVDGVITLSVSQILKYIFPNKYSNVPQSVLSAKATHGQTVHEAIECFEKGKDLPSLNDEQLDALQRYIEFKDTHGFKVIKQEEIISYKGMYCGRYDMIVEDISEELCLVDVKTTETLDKNYLSWQLSLYELAYEYTFETEQFPFSKFKCLWLPKKKKGGYVSIERIPREELLKTLEETLCNA